MSATESPLGRTLLALARAAIAARFALPSQTPGEVQELVRLEAPGASFVTLTLEGRLRGCIGSLDAYRPLRQDVEENARAAAFRDPRFAPLTEKEFARTSIEVSLPGPPAAIECSSEADLLAQLRPGRDGLILEHAGRRATFLPQVWDTLGQPRDFLRELKHKAGLPANFWDGTLRFARYEVEKWREA